MGSLPTGSNRLLEVQSGNIRVVIKSSKPIPHPGSSRILEQSSELRVSGSNVTGVRIWGEERIGADNGAVGTSFYSFHTPPLFFEETDYEIIIRSTDGKPLSFWHENYGIREKIGPVTDSGDLISGIIHFGSHAGFSDLEISCEGKRCLVIRVEVFPSRISYKEDYQNMLQDISNEIAGAVLDFMGSTYREFAAGSTQNTIPALFFGIIQQSFTQLRNAANRILAAPHHRLYVDHPIVPAHKVKKTDPQTVKWLRKHPQHIVSTEGGFSALKAPAVRKRITYNTAENQFTKFILKSTEKRLKDFRDRYILSTRNPEQAVLDSADEMISVLNKLLSRSFLRDVGEYSATQSMSLVFEMAPGYRELYKYHLILQRGLSVHGDVFRMSLKDTALLYEYWCFIKLVTILKRSFRLASSDVIKVDRTGVTITLVKGRRSEVKFVNPRMGERITLTYNPGEQDTQTVGQTPDNVLTLEKKGTDVPYMYVFDAKYRMESDPADSSYPDSNPGPKLEDINTMHRYRDSIVYEDTDSSRFLFEKKMFGAYVLFPYSDPQGEYKNHRFYKSIEAVNIGGLPFLPGTTGLVESFLAELIADSSESAFERASVPRGTEEKLAKVDWSVRDVMVGTVRTVEQLRFNIDKRGYYVPAKYIGEHQLPIRYIALHEEGISDTAGIKRFGEVLTTQIIKRGRIPVTMRPGGNPEELYYYFTVRKWIDLPQIIEIKDSFRGKPQFTNKFLLDHCTKSYQLFAISSGEEYRLMVEISKVFQNLSAAASRDSTAVYRVNGSHSVIVDESCFTVSNDQGGIIERIPISSFARSPRACFNRIKKLVG